MPARHSRRARVGKHASGSPRLLRCEQLESRTVLAAISPLGNLHLLGYSPVGNLGMYGKATVGTPPTVAKAASASVNSSGCVTGMTTALRSSAATPWANRAWSTPGRSAARPGAAPPDSA